MASDRSSASFTGAENPRRSDGVGGASMPSKWKDCSASRSSRTFVGAASEPSAARRPTATGMWNGALFGCPGVASVDCESVSVYLYRLRNGPTADHHFGERQRGEGQVCCVCATVKASHTLAPLALENVRLCLAFVAES